MNRLPAILLLFVASLGMFSCSATIALPEIQPTPQDHQAYRLMAGDVVDLQITVRLAKGEGQAPIALIDTHGRRYDADPEAGTTNKLVFVPVAAKEPPGGAAVTLARYRGADAETTNDVEITPVEWGYQLCDQPVENPRWQ